MSCSLSAVGPFSLIEVLMDLTDHTGQFEPLLWLVMFFYAGLSFLILGFSVYRRFFRGHWAASTTVHGTLTGDSS
jgi:hypothetical protein